MPLGNGMLNGISGARPGVTTRDAADLLPREVRTGLVVVTADGRRTRGREIRTDTAPYDLRRAIGPLVVTTSDDDEAHTQRMVMLLPDGLRFGARTP